MKNANAKKAAELVGKAHSALSSLYGKGKEATKKAIHDKKKSITREVLDDTKKDVSVKEKETLRTAEKIVRDKYKTGGKLIGNQYKLDVNKNGKIDAEDLAIIRGEKMADGGEVDRQKYNDLIGRKENEFYILESIFKHSDDFEGATGVVVVPVTAEHYEYALSKDGILERYMDAQSIEEWAEHFGIEESNGVDLEDEVAEAIWEASRYGGFEPFEEADYKAVEQIRSMVPEFASEEEYPIFEVVGAGRIFSKHNNFDEVYNPELLAKIEGVEKMERGKNVKGSKHVHLTKGYRNPHGYKAVKGADKNKDYSKGHPHIKVDKGFAMPHGYEAVDGTYNKKYDRGGGVHKHVSVKRGYRLPHGYEAVKGATKKADYSHKGVEMDLGWRLPHGYVLEKGADSKAYYRRGGGLDQRQIWIDEIARLRRYLNSKTKWENMPKEDVERIKNSYRQVIDARIKSLSEWDEAVAKQQLEKENRFARGGGVESCTPEEKMFVRALIERYMDNLSSDGKEVATSVLEKLK